MKKNAYLNGQDILNWYKTSFDMRFTDDGFPILERLESLYIPRRGLKILPFNYALSNKDKDYFVHFYIQDYLFNRIWNNPNRYIQILKQYKGIVMPDFSLYTDMPEPLQRFNHYRNLWFARMCQIEGITVIPSPNWSTKNSLKWSLHGIPQKSVIMLSCVGSIQNKNVYENFKCCVKIMEEELEPRIILIRSTKKSFEKIKSFINTPCNFIDYIV